jgi:HD-GYP domain-containing protein (c-di-GMP phosphodiesterase class II)
VALANAVDARDPYTIGHNWRVSRLATTVASYLDWTDNAIGRIELGGILHDIGKIGVRDAILLKNGPLDQLEMKTMQRHPELGTRMINGIDCLLPVIPHILYHHEHWDGNGYPYGLRGAEIPKEGRLLAVCDAFDAMSTTRPYRVALKPQEAINELVRNSGKQFDPNFVSAFITTWESGKITRNLERIGKGYLSQKSSHAYTELQNFSSVL